MSSKKTPGSGRVAGTPNRKTQDLLNRCHASGVDPFQILLDLAGTSLDETMRFNAAKELCQYLYPKRKALEHPSDEGFTVTIRDYCSPTETISRHGPQKLQTYFVSLPK